MEPLSQKLQLYPSAVNVSLPVHVVTFGWNKVFSLARGIFLFVLFVCVFYTIWFFPTCVG